MRIIKKIDWSSPDLLPKNLILIDGITRSGKSLVGPIVGSLNKVYPMQHQALLDNLMPILHQKNIQPNIVRSLLIFYFNQNIYSLNISRCVNFRPEDNSSLINTKESYKHLENLIKKEGDHIIKEIIKKNYSPIFITHDLLSMIDSFKKLNIPFKLIYTYRHPIDNIFSFFKKYGKKLTAKNKFKYDHNNPRIYQMMIKEKNTLLPYYVKNKSKEFLSLNSAEKSVFYYLSSLERSIAKYKKHKKNILLIRYDDFAERTKKELVKISKFLNCKTSSFTKKCLKFNNVPRVMDIDARKEKKRIISKLINNNFYEKVESITEKYESKTLF